MSDYSRSCVVDADRSRLYSGHVKEGTKSKAYLSLLVADKASNALFVFPHTQHLLEVGNLFAVNEDLVAQSHVVTAPCFAFCLLTMCTQSNARSSLSQYHSMDSVIQKFKGCLLMCGVVPALIYSQCQL